MGRKTGGNRRRTSHSQVMVLRHSLRLGRLKLRIQNKSKHAGIIYTYRQRRNASSIGMPRGGHKEGESESIHFDGWQPRRSISIASEKSSKIRRPNQIQPLQQKHHNVHLQQLFYEEYRILHASYKFLGDGMEFNCCTRVAKVFTKRRYVIDVSTSGPIWSVPIPRPENPTSILLARNYKNNNVNTGISQKITDGRPA